MAKGLRLVRPNLSTPGRALGHVLCRVSVPTCAEPFNYYMTSPTGLRRLLYRELPRSEGALEGAWVKVSIAVRKSSRAIGYTSLGRWRHGESIEQFLDDVSRAWRALPKENPRWS